VPARSGGELVWIPIGQKGALVTVGGTPVDLNTTFSADKPWTTRYNRTELESLAQKFMEEVSVYDIANDKWFTQPTSGDIPPSTAEFCTVVASSQDGASHQVDKLALSRVCLYLTIRVDICLWRL
jgi:hypothetical protein